MGFGIFDSFAQASEDEKRMRGLQEKLTELDESPIRMAAETGIGQISQFVGSFARSSGKQRAAGFADIRSTLLGDFRQGLSGEQFTKFSSAFQEFQKSFPQGSAAVEVAGEKLSKVLADLAKESQKAKTAIEAQIQVEKLRQLIGEVVTKETTPEFGKAMTDLYNPAADGFAA